MIRIGVDARPLANPNNGIGRYLSETLRYILKGENQWYLYSHVPINLPEPPPKNVQFRSLKAVPVRRMSSITAQRIFGRWAKNDNVDVFWSPRHHLPNLIDTPSVVTIHDLVWKMAPETMMTLGRLSERWLMPPTIRRATRIITPSHSTSNDLTRYFPAAEGKTCVIPLAPHVFPDTQRQACADPYVLFVGTLEPRKNVPRIIQAFRRVIDADPYPLYRLLIAGGAGWKTRKLRRELANQTPESRIHYLGPVDDETLAGLYAGADFLVAPSLYEGFGLQLVEAMSFGKPVITSNCASMPEVSNGASILVDPMSVDEMANAIRTLIRDRYLHQRLSEHAYAHAALYDWRNTAQKTLSVLIDAARS